MVADGPFLRGVQSHDFIPIVPREEAQAQVADQNRSMQEVLQEFTITDYSETQLNTFIDQVTGISKPYFHKFLLYVLRFVEYNRSRYERLKNELGRIKEKLASMKDDLMTVMVSCQEPGPRLAAVPATIPPLAPQAMALPLAPQAMAPPLASQALATGHVVGSTTYCPPVLNADGTISCKMDQVGNNITATFSGNDDMTLLQGKKFKLFDSSAKLDTFSGHDMSQFPEWVTQFLSGVNLFQPTEPSACKVALHLLRGKAAEIAKNIPQQVSMTNLQELLTGLDKIFNTTGNRIVAVNLFNSFSQREDMSVQDYSIGIKHLFYQAYPRVDPNGSIFLMDCSITGLVSPQVKEKLRIPLQPGNFRDTVNSAMAFTAAMFPEHQTLRQWSLAWKMATSSNHPLLTKSIHKDPKGSIQVIDESPEGEVNIQAIRQWCAFHKSDKHSNSDCRAQQDSTTSTAQTSKKRPIGVTKKDNKPRRLKFKSKSEKKKFLRSIEETEEVSLESYSSNDETVVEQSLMQLDPVSSNEALDEEGDSNLHILVIDSNPPLAETDVIMDESDLSRVPSESDSLYPFESNISTKELDSAVNSISLEGEKIVSAVQEEADYASLSPSDTALLDSSLILTSKFKLEDNPLSPRDLSG